MGRSSKAADLVDWALEPRPQALVALYRLQDSNPKLALEPLRELADEGSPMSMVYLGIAYQLGLGTAVSLEDAEHWFERASDLGCIPAYDHLGRLLLRLGRGEEARSAFYAAASKNYTPALHQLGKMYFFGRGVAQDYEKALPLLERAASDGSVFAKRRLAQYYLEHWLGVRSFLKGVRLLTASIVEKYIVTWTEGERSLRLR